MSEQSFRAFQAVSDGDSVERGVVELSVDDLPDDGPLIEVHYSSVNYKDGLATIPKGRVAQISPLVPGVDLSGVLVEDTDEFPAGTEVIAHCYDIGVARHGGYAEYARVPADQLVRLPEGLTMREAMVLGTGGFTAGRCVVALGEHGVLPDSGQILVTGATGGVGSTAVGMLADAGYEVVASTGKPEAAGFLRDLGAAEIIDRAQFSEEGRPLQSMRWAGAVDCVGGVTLANVLAQINYGGSVAACGLTGGGGLSTTVMPFILRNVNLLGIDAVMVSIELRRAVWGRLATDLKPAGLDQIGHDIGLDDLDQVLTDILAGKAKGRSVVALRN